MDNFVVYRIVVKGRLSETWSERFQGMDIAVETTEEDGFVSILEGPLRDQAALSGVLNTLYERHYAVLSVERIKKSEEGEE